LRALYRYTSCSTNSIDSLFTLRSTEEFFNSPKNLELLSREREDSVDRNDRDEKDEKDGNKKYSLRSNSNGKQKDGIVVVEIEPSRPGLR
jgi:hypothetical protein